MRRRAVAVIVIVAAVALVWALGRTVDQGQAAAADARLAGDLQIAHATLDAELTRAGARASAIARAPGTGAALARGDAAALDALAASHPETVFVGAGGARGGSFSGPGVEKVAEVVAGGKGIGSVVTQAPLNASYVALVRANLPRGSRDLLVVTDGGAVTAGPLPPGTSIGNAPAGNISAAGHQYRALSSVLTSTPTRLQIVALTSTSRGILAGWRLPLAVIATLGALALLVAWAASPLRDGHVQAERRSLARRRDAPAGQPEAPVSGALALLGETLGATHDEEALLDVILDAAIAATGATGGRLARGGSPPDRAQTQRGALTVTLETNEPGESYLVLDPPPGGFSAEAVAVAHWLGIQSSTALANARMHRVVEQHALTDDLTGLANRRRFTSTLQAEIARAERFGTPLALLMADLDNFKAINDRYGHAAGDVAIVTFGRVLEDAVRRIDLAARIGGDEFALLLPQTDAEGAREVAERLRQALEAQTNLPEPLTVSLGVSCYPEAVSAEELLVAADICLYRAKQSGRNQVVVGQGAVPEAPR